MNTACARQEQEPASSEATEAALEEPSRGLRSRLRARHAAGLAAVVAATLIAFLVGPLLEAGDSDRDDAHLSVSELTFDGLQETGAPVDAAGRRLAEYGGRPLVVNFFAAWCPPCVREMPEFQRVFEALEGRVEFLGLSQDRTVQDTLDLVAATGVTYDIGWDLDLEVYQATGSISMPTTAFVSPEGELLDTFAGALDQEALTERIRRLFGVGADS
ncbi:MAG: TlpA disulfide reductase family protein [Acidimicrobiaceae bacterium]|nr:TlpA disulfide reductase family protein [Acidimicrobiaceae bacterium]MCY4280221.1 TlpA disulfide reductase family protein [Acidimicrobiaceae bacterium]MCY4293597.1 TlpA disulfide reductase family protein [Acidimicrobiaceae bacterium]